jgi:hypothetical protein
LDLLKSGAKIKNCFQDTFKIGTVPFKIVWNGFLINCECRLADKPQKLKSKLAVL